MQSMYSTPYADILRCNVYPGFALHCANIHSAIQLGAFIGSMIMVNGNFIMTIFHRHQFDYITRIFDILSHSVCPPPPRPYRTTRPLIAHIQILLYPFPLAVFPPRHKSKQLLYWIWLFTNISRDRSGSMQLNLLNLIAHFCFKVFAPMFYCCFQFRLQTRSICWMALFLSCCSSFVLRLSFSMVASSIFWIFLSSFVISIDVWQTAIFALLLRHIYRSMFNLLFFIDVTICFQTI